MSQRLLSHLYSRTRLERSPSDCTATRVVVTLLQPLDLFLSRTGNSANASQPEVAIRPYALCQNTAKVEESSTRSAQIDYNGLKLVPNLLGGPPPNPGGGRSSH